MAFKSAAFPEPTFLNSIFLQVFHQLIKLYSVLLGKTFGLVSPLNASLCDRVYMQCWRLGSRGQVLLLLSTSPAAEVVTL